MPNVSADYNLFADRRLDRLARKVECKNRAVGILMNIWHQSQERELELATSDQLREWAWYEESDPFNIVDALTKCGFIDAEENGNFRIRGNGRHIDNNRTYKRKGKAGGAATKKRWDGKPLKSVDAEGLEPSPSLAQVQPSPSTGPSPDRHTTLHYTTSHNTTGGGDLPAPAPEEKTYNPITEDETPAEQIWWCYYDRYLERVKQDPIDNPKQRKLCSQILDRLGGDLELALRVVTYFVTCKNPHYWERVYPLTICLADAESNATKVRGGFESIGLRPV